MGSTKTFVHMSSLQQIKILLYQVFPVTTKIGGLEVSDCSLSITNVGIIAS